MNIVKKIKSMFKKKSSSRGGYYVDEYKGATTPGGDDYTQLHNKARQDIGSSFWH